MRAIISAFFVAVALGGIGLGETARGAAPDTVVVCPSEFRSALDVWTARRQAEGRTVVFVSNAGSPEEIRQRIRGAAPAEQLRFIVLVGDADPAMTTDAKIRARCVPTHLAEAKVNVHWGSEPRIATDNWYADLDDDDLPDAAIGRLTADSPAELKKIVAKIIRFESESPTGIWRRRINFVAGVGGFGALVDGAIEAGAKSLITGGVPSAYDTTMTYGSWQSPYCPDPREFHGAALERLNEGSLFWVYIGHGHRTGLDRVRVPGARYPILSSADVPKIHAAQGSPIALMLACHTGAFDAAEDCLAEQMLARDGAPAAILCGSRVTMPYAMATMSQEMLAQCFERRRETVGELMLHAKREMMVEGRKNSQRQMLDVIAKLISPAKTTLADERREHLHLFNLIGDPTMRIAHPETVAVETSSRAVAGQLLEIAGTSPVDGRCTVELVVRRDRLTFDPPARSRYDGSDAALAAYQKTYRRANRAAYTSVAVDAVDGKFSTQLDVPTEANGPCHVRVFVAGKSKFAMGASNVYVQRSGAAAGN